MSPKLYKSLLAGLMIILLTFASLVQNNLVAQRTLLGLDRYTELKGAPPILALTTVALGGFRGIISNILWIRATELQDDDKFFEMVQLADWITKLEPHFSQVWLVQAWNMAYNISVKFKDASDRWRWVQRGIELLRDDGIRYNPNDVLIHRELAWFFQHKMGANLDDANNYYKQMWANEMFKVFGLEQVNWDMVLNPKTADEKSRVELLKNKYKMDPIVMKQVDDLYGPLEWRLPEASAIYWAYQGLEAAKRNPRKIDPNDLITLRRVVYQSMQLSFQRGRLIMNRVDKNFQYGPNLGIIQHTSEAYERAMDEDAKNKDHIQTAHRNFLRDAVFFLYTYNREADALKWYKYLIKEYPDKPLLTGVPNSLPTQINMDEFCLGRIQDEINDMGMDKAEAIIEGLESRALESLAVDDDEHFAGLDRMAQKAWVAYQSKISGSQVTLDRVGLKPFAEIRKIVIERVLNEELSPQLGAVLRTKLKMPSAKDEAKEKAAQSASPDGSSTNAVAVPDAK